MPATIAHMGEGTRMVSTLSGVNYAYDYPDGMDLKPGSDLHQKIVTEVNIRARLAKEGLQHRYSSWEEMDRLLQVHRRPDGSAVKVDRRSAVEKHEASYKYVVPVSFINLETLLTYFSTAFLRDPVFRYSGVGPEDRIGATLMELLVQQQVSRNGVGLSLHTMFRDSMAYGIGPTQAVWDTQYGFRTVEVEKTTFDSLLNVFIPRTMKARERSERTLLYEGNKLNNIDPFNYLPDPDISAHDVREAEFMGWIQETSYTSLLSKEADAAQNFFNVRYLQHVDTLSTHYYNAQTRTPVRKGTRPQGTKAAHVVWMYINIIPKEWGLGDYEYPEKWLFAVGGDDVVLFARPLGLHTDQIPIACIAPNFDGHTGAPISHLEITHDMQRMANFLFNSHVENIRKVLNNNFVVDPSRVNIHDLENLYPGKPIRMRRGSWGRDSVREAISQLEVRDVTANSWGDLSMIRTLIEDSTGATDIVSGKIQRSGPRVSASEASGARSSGFSRLERLATIISMQGMAPIGRMFAANTQQLMQNETFVRIAQETLTRLQQDLPNAPSVEHGRAKVSPADLLVDYDLDITGNVVPGSEDVQAWLTIFQAVVSTPDPNVQAEFNLGGMLRHIARQMGAKSIDDFTRVPQQAQPPMQPPGVMDDEQVQSEVQAGNLVPDNGL